MTVTKTINWVALSHCPAKQLEKANPTDAGFDIRIAKTAWIKPYSMLPFEWEDVGLRDEVENEVPDLFDPVNYPVFLNPASGDRPEIRVRDKFLVKFAPGDNATVLKGLNKLTNVIISEFSAGVYAVDCRYIQSDLEQIEGVVSVEKAVFLQRRKYKPILIPTGIKVQPQELAWTAITLRSSMTKYAISMQHSLGVVDFSYSGELMIGVYPIEGQTVFRYGERIAQLIPMEQFEVNLVQIPPDDFVNHGRGGFGSSNVIDIAKAA